MSKRRVYHLLPFFLALAKGSVPRAVRVGSHTSNEEILPNVQRCLPLFLRSRMERSQEWDPR